MIKTIRSKKGKEEIYSNRIAELIEAKGMSAKEVADMSGMFDSHLSAIMSGKRKCISLPIAFKIANALKTPIEKVFIYKRPLIK
ncbi:MAG TPA: helix-turn-helix transcriptional regulator [Chitinophagales bacterium]|nr:helix-turn-helix transcriptional regulator [Chitinophagales bacterium]